MKTTHTPGPWYSRTTSADQAIIASETTGENVAVAYDPKNGALIAAAPDLLAALEEIATLKGMSVATHAKAIAAKAIAKARGEG